MRRRLALVRAALACGQGAEAVVQCIAHNAAAAALRAMDATERHAGRTD
jgi:hypothetical protein